MTRRKTHLEEVLLLLQQQLHLGMLQAGTAPALPPPWAGPSPWGSSAHCGTGYQARDTPQSWQLCPAPAQLPHPLPCPCATHSTSLWYKEPFNTSHGGMALQVPRHSGDTSCKSHPAGSTPGSPHTHPQHGDHGGVSETPVLILEVVSLWSLVPLADLPELHSLIWGRRGEHHGAAP